MSSERRAELSEAVRREGGAGWRAGWWCAWLRYHCPYCRRERRRRGG